MKELSSLWRSRVLEKTGGRCRKCGSPAFVQGHHIFGKKAYPSGKYLISNGIPLCRGCHFTAHNKPEEFRYFLIGVLGGEDHYHALYVKVSRAEFRVRSVSDIEYIKKALMDGANIF